MLRELDAEQRNKLLSDIKRAALANRIIVKAGRRAGALKRIRPTPDHRIMRAFGTVPAWRREREKD